MARPTESERYELSDALKRDLITLIQAGKPLPEKYRFLLFADKREVELVWNGKTREVCNVVLPFQTLEHIDEPRKETREGEFDLDIRGRQLKGWTNKLIWGDNKLILASLKAGALRRQIEDAGGLKLIYIDPPFDVGADFSMDIEIGGETFHKEPNLLEQIAYRDTWGRGADSFISMIYERLILMRDLLHEEGSIYVHCDWRVSSYIRAVLDEIFGNRNFRNELTWKRRLGTSSSVHESNRFGICTDVIFFYSASDSAVLTPQYNMDSPDYQEYIEAKFTLFDENGRRFHSGDLGNPAPRPTLMYEYKGHKPPKNGWAINREKMEQWDREGRLHFPKEPGGRLRRKRYLDELKGMPVQNLWTDITEINSQAMERLDYPTQKPEALLERILKASSNEGDLVADFFGGSGTTAAVAEKLGRKWIATDLGKFGIHTTRKRLIGVQRELKVANKEFRAFEVLNLGRYERQAYLNVGGNLNSKMKAAALAQKEREFRDLILKAYKAQPLEGEPFFHGKHAGRLVVVGPINLPVGRLFVEEVIIECRKRGASRADVLAFEFEMGLFPAVLEEAKQKGIDLAPKAIPPEVFDKRAVEKGQVRFHDISYIEATPRFDKKNKLSVSVELTDFSVYYSQGLADALSADLKEGKSEVICEQGKLIKVSKDKNGIVTHNVLTKHWTDWVDYWAIDFDYENRKEIISAPKNMGVDNQLPGMVARDEFVVFEERWTGAYIFENEWQSFRTRKDRELELKSVPHVYPKAGRYVIPVKVIDIFGNDTMSLVTVNVG